MAFCRHVSPRQHCPVMYIMDQMQNGIETQPSLSDRPEFVFSHRAAVCFASFAPRLASCDKRVYSIVALIEYMETRIELLLDSSRIASASTGSSKQGKFTQLHENRIANRSNRLLQSSRKAASMHFVAELHIRMPNLVRSDELSPIGQNRANCLPAENS